MATLPPPPPGICRVTVTGNSQSEVWANVFWANLTGGISAVQNDLDGWCLALFNAYKTNFGPALPSTVNMVSASATLFQSAQLALHSIQGTQAPGTAVGAGIAENSAARVVSWASNVYWRGGKPRTYIPSVLTSESTDWKTITTAAATALQAKAAAFHAAVNGLTSGGITATQHGFISYYSGGTVRTTPVFFPILGAAVHKRIGSQRRRLGPWVA